MTNRNRGSRSNASNRTTENKANQNVEGLEPDQTPNEAEENTVVTEENNEVTASTDVGDNTVADEDTEENNEPTTLNEPEPEVPDTKPVVSKAEASTRLIGRADLIVDAFVGRNNLVNGTSNSPEKLADAVRDFGRGVFTLLGSPDRKAAVAAYRHVLDRINVQAATEVKKTDGKHMFDMKHMLRHIDCVSGVQKSEINRIENLMVLMAETHEPETRVKTAKKFGATKISESAPNDASASALRAAYNL